MGPRQFKTCVYSAKPSDDLTGPGPPLAGKKPSPLKVKTISSFHPLFRVAFSPYEKCGDLFSRRIKKPTSFSGKSAFTMESISF